MATTITRLVTIGAPRRPHHRMINLLCSCVAVIAAAAASVASLNSSDPSATVTPQSAGAWGKIPAAARGAISQGIGARDPRFLVTHGPVGLITQGAGFSAAFGRGGVAVHGTGVSMHLGLEAIGRGRSLVDVGSASPVAAKNTVTYGHAGISEWYANGPLGLEQGFTLDRRPSGAAALTLLVGRVPATARVRVAPSGQSMTVAAVHHGGVVISYSNLTVTDATGRRVASRIAVADGRVLLQVNDARATYPLRIDPTVQAAGLVLSETVANNPNNNTNNFGESVAVSQDGTTIAVGMPGGGANFAGVVYVYTISAGGQWQDPTPTAELTASDGADDLGTSVAVSGDGQTIVAGTPANDGASSNDSLGAVYVFTKPASGGWQTATQTAELSASDGVSGDDFGSAVAVSEDGSTVVVGAADHQVGSNGNQGAAYVFSDPTTGGWRNTTQTAELTASDGVENDELGFSVATSEDGGTIVAGAPERLSNTNDSGAAYVFSRPTSDGWQNATQTAELGAASTFGLGQLGISVAISSDNDTIVAGAGRVAYVYSKASSDAWQTATQTATLTETYDSDLNTPWLSVAVTDNGDEITAGSLGYAFVFSEPASGGWQDSAQATQLAETDNDITGGGYGMPVSMSGDGSTVALGDANAGQVQLFPPAPVDQTLPTVSGEPISGETLIEMNGTWSGDPTAYRHTWEDCDSSGASCSAAPGAADTSYTLSDTDVGSTVRVTEAATDAADGTGIPVISAQTDVVQPLSATTPPGISGEAVQGDTLTETHGSWNGPVTGYTYEWERCDSSGHNCMPILNSFFVPYIGQSYTVQDADAGSTIAVEETASNLGGPGETASSTPTSVVRQLSATSAPTIVGQALQGETLTEGNALWNGPVSSYTYQWEDCESSGGNCSPIHGATQQSYTLSNADAGARIVVVEDASNDGGPGVQTDSAPTNIVIPLPPNTSQPPTISGTAVEGDVLTASTLPWANRPTNTSYQWEDCNTSGQACQPISGATAKSYTLGASDVGVKVVVGESASNAGGSSAVTVSAASATVAESGPVGLEIDDGDYATDSPNVTIEPVWPAGTQSILISNDGGFRTSTETVSPASTIQWTLEQTGSDRLPKTVYIRFLGVGQDDINFTDDIILDETAPTIQSATIGGAADRASAASAKLKSYKLRIRAKDQIAGVCAVLTSQTRSSSGATLTSLDSCKTKGITNLSRTLELSMRSRPRYVRVQNSAGDWSRWLAIKS